MNFAKMANTDEVNYSDYSPFDNHVGDDSEIRHFKRIVNAFKCYKCVLIYIDNSSHYPCYCIIAHVKVKDFLLMYYHCFFKDVTALAMS